MTSTSEVSLKKATGKTWAYWFEYLDGINARELSHKDIAARLQEEGGVSGWWAQTITVEYERKTGRREVGQSCEGTFQASASKTLPGTMDDVFRQWLEFVKDMDQFDQVSIDGAPQSSETPKWRYWRMGLKDDSKVSAIINQKTPEKTLLAINHEKLKDAEAVNRWKAFWKGFLQSFSETRK